MREYRNPGLEVFLTPNRSRCRKRTFYRVKKNVKKFDRRKRAAFPSEIRWFISGHGMKFKFRYVSQRSFFEEQDKKQDGDVCIVILTCIWKLNVLKILFKQKRQYVSYVFFLNITSAFKFCRKAGGRCRKSRRGKEKRVSSPCFFVFLDYIFSYLLRTDFP